MSVTPDEIKAIRERYNLRQEDLARLLNVRPSTVSRWEAGDRTPLQKHIRAMRDLVLSLAEMDAEDVLAYTTADADTRNAMDAVRHAERQQLSPLAMSLAGNAAREAAHGTTQAEWILSKQHLDQDQLDAAISELMGAGLWPWR